jgi:phosphotransferase system enzyme I (PtsI)
MSYTIHGIAVANGIAIGRAHLFSHSSIEVTHYTIKEEQIDQEIVRFKDAIADARDELETLQANIPDNAPTEFSAFLQLHLMILNDGTLSNEPTNLIRHQQCNAEWALRLQMEQLIEQFQLIEDPYLRERQADVVQVVERILKALTGKKSAAMPTWDKDEEIILVAHDLGPADMLVFKNQAFQAFITDMGGATSHTAILARGLSIPSVVALHHAWHIIKEGELLIIDGTCGVVIVNPDETVLTEYRVKQEQWNEQKKKLKKLRLTPAKSLDNEEILLLANIESPQDMDTVKKSGALGVGLYRTEFLFMNRITTPGEEEQFKAYRKVVESMKGQPIIIRTLDIGADKPIDSLSTGHTLNPALGLRAVRYCLSEPHLFKIQLRAILRVSQFGDVHCLIPMISSNHEVNQTMAIIHQAKQELLEEGIAFNQHLPVGAMIEVPAAALALPLILDSLDFISIGTNDLIQYTLAIDRSDDAVAHLYNPAHPAILSLLANTIAFANSTNKPVSVCGEMAGDPRFTRLLLGMGLKEFSMHPAHIPEVKQIILNTDIEKTKKITKKILKTYDFEKINALISELNQH